MTRFLAPAAVILVVALAWWAWSGSSETPSEPASEEMIAVAAQIRCDQQRYAFDALAELDGHVEAALARAGVGIEEYERFEARLEDDADARAAVLEQFRTVCA